MYQTLTELLNCGLPAMKKKKTKLSKIKVQSGLEPLQLDLTGHISADSVPTSNLVCIEEIAIRTTFSHMINMASV